MKRFFALILILGTVLTTEAQQQGKPSKEQLNKSLDKVEKKRAEIQSRIRKVDKARSAVKRDIRAVDQDLTRVSTLLDQTEDKLETSVNRRDIIAGDLEVAAGQMTDQRRKIENRLRQIYRTPDHSVLSLLSGSDSFSDLAERKTLLERIAKRDREVFEQFKKLRSEIQQKKSEQESLIGDIKDLKSQHEERKDDLEGVQEEKKEVLHDLERQRRQLEREFAQFDRQSRILQDRIANYQRERKASGTEINFSGVMVKPASGPYTSSFGSRYHPILKRTRPHNGVDIGADHGSSIRAAASGIVITSGWMSGYGNTVVIDHGDGVSTLYGHCSVLYVNDGDTVVMGDRIAAVGSTGLATGPHLHFEVRINGRPVNPVRYLP